MRPLHIKPQTEWQCRATRRKLEISDCLHDLNKSSVKRQLTHMGDFIINFMGLQQHHVSRNYGNRKKSNSFYFRI